MDFNLRKFLIILKSPYLDPHFNTCMHHMFGARRGSMPSADGMDHPQMAWDPRLAWPWRAIRGSMDGMAAFGARCGSRSSADGPGQMRMTHLMQDFLPFHLFGANRGPRPPADGLASLTKMKTFWVVKYLNIYSTNK